jgi:hypothetical protein
VAWRELDGREDLKRTIETAFAAVPYPGDQLIVYNPRDWEAAEYRAEFAGKHWLKVIDPVLLQRRRTFPMFSIDGMRFYLPAYLIATIDFPAEAVEWIGPLIQTLYPDCDPPWIGGEKVRDYAMQQWDQLMRILTAQQKHAIRLFFEYLLMTAPDYYWLISAPPGNRLSLVLANYWNQF